MAAPGPNPENILQTAIAAVHQGGDQLLRALDELPAPIYVTNADGIVTHYNRACIAFAGRTPRVGGDSWCVTWKLYTDQGQFLPHDQCPMAVAIRERRTIRGCGAVAERPDGTRVKFMPYPTPLLDDDGDLVGAVNLLLEINDRQQVQTLLTQAARCRRLAGSVSDRQTMAVLTAMAAEYDEKALTLEQVN